MILKGITETVKFLSEKDKFKSSLKQNVEMFFA